MAYTAQELITDAWYMSNILTKGLEEISAEQLTDGLNRLNAILGVATSDMGLLPYYREYTDNFVVAQEKYYVPGLASIQTMVFNLFTESAPSTNSVRYSLEETSREEYFGTGRANNIVSLPGKYHREARFDGSDVYVYPLPVQTWPFTIWGKFQLEEVTLTTDLSLVYQRFYREYLLYKLAHYLCQYYNVMFPLVQKEQLREYEDKIRNVSPPSLTMKKISMFASGTPLNYAQANFSTSGFTRP